MSGVESKNVGSPDEVREFPYGRGDIVNIGGGQVSRMTLQPGWRWSEHIKPVAKTEWCEAPHFQYVISGHMGVMMADGSQYEAHPGDVLILPPGHDGWVIGDEPAILVDWGGAHVWGKPSE